MTRAASRGAGGPGLPALRTGTDGRRHVDMRAVAALALPLVLNSTMQAVLNLTDTWFIGRLSTTATAAVAAVHWLALLALILIGGVAMSVQTIVAQAHGAGRYRRASQAVWNGLWASLLTIPAFAGVIVLAPGFLGLFDLPSGIEALALDYWGPRMIGGPFAAALWAAISYFNGVGRTRAPLAIGLIVTLGNVVLNEILIFRVGFGIAGAAWATTIAEFLGLALAIAWILKLEPRRFRPALTWRPRWDRMRVLVTLGLPMAMTASADLGAAALFQLMQVRVGIEDGAATQIVMIFTSLAYMPGIGVALAGTTLVGQAIGAGDRDWAEHLGNRIITIVACFMGGLGVLMALAGSWLAPLFVNDTDPHAARVIALCTTLLWMAAAYQFFDGINFASAFCLRGAGDVHVPAALVFFLAVALFLPLAYLLTFAPGTGWIPGAPGLGLGAVGGWSALVVYVLASAAALGLRWRRGAWRRIRVTV
jgi:MATE family multidrug resistance protein